MPPRNYRDTGSGSPMVRYCERAEAATERDAGPRAHRKQQTSVKQGIGRQDTDSGIRSMRSTLHRFVVVVVGCGRAILIRIPTVRRGRSHRVAWRWRWRGAGEEGGCCHGPAPWPARWLRCCCPPPWPCAPRTRAAGPPWPRCAPPPCPAAAAPSAPSAPPPPAPGVPRSRGPAQRTTTVTVALSVPLSSCRGQQAARKCSYRSDRVSRD